MQAGERHHCLLEHVRGQVSEIQVRVAAQECGEHCRPPRACIRIGKAQKGDHTAALGQPGINAGQGDVDRVPVRHRRRRLGDHRADPERRRLAVEDQRQRAPDRRAPAEIGFGDPLRDHGTIGSRKRCLRIARDRRQREQREIGRIDAGDLLRREGRAVLYRHLVRHQPRAVDLGPVAAHLVEQRHRRWDRHFRRARELHRLLDDAHPVPARQHPVVTRLEPDEQEQHEEHRDAQGKPTDIEYGVQTMTGERPVQGQQRGMHHVDPSRGAARGRARHGRRAMPGRGR